VEKEKVIFGRNVVLEYIRGANNLSGEILVSDSAHGKIIDTIVSEAKRRSIRVRKVPREELDSYHRSANHQGVILLMTGGTRVIDDDDLIAQCVSSRGVLVLLDQLTDPHNIGAIIRTAEALGALGVIMPKAHAPESGSTIAKTSAGATAHIPVVITANAARFIDDAKSAGIWVVGSDDTGTTSMSSLSSIRPVLLVIGNEGMGMRRLTSEKCDYIVRIPLKGKVSSLNASVAAGILLYEILR
jgi:23S rRNA (guanosine2251-2'-O)-methyltransferase